MGVKVKLLASFADRFGRCEIDLAHVSGMTVQDVWDQATAGSPVLPNTLSAVNFEYCGLQAAVNDGDEVAFFPPVTGG